VVQLTQSERKLLGLLVHVGSVLQRSEEMNSNGILSQCGLDSFTLEKIMEV